MPALSGRGIQDSRRRRIGLRDRAAAEQSRAIVKYRRLTGSTAMFGLYETDPLAVADSGHGRRQRAHLDGHLALILAEPIPILDLHRIDCQRASRPNDDPRLIRLDADHV